MSQGREKAGLQSAQMPPCSPSSPHTGEEEAQTQPEPPPSAGGCVCVIRYVRQAESKKQSKLSCNISKIQNEKKKTLKNILKEKESEQQHHKKFEGWMNGRMEGREGGAGKGGREEIQRKMGLSLLPVPPTLCALSLAWTLCLSFPHVGSWGVGGQETGGKGQDPWT